MEFLESSFSPSARPGQAGMTLKAYCPNPACPGNDSELAGPAAGEAERIERETGGDTGLADGR